MPSDGYNFDPSDHPEKWFHGSYGFGRLEPSPEWKAKRHERLATRRARGDGEVGDGA